MNSSQTQTRMCIHTRTHTHTYTHKTHTHTHIHAYTHKTHTHTHTHTHKGTETSQLTLPGTTRCIHTFLQDVILHVSLIHKSVYSLKITILPCVLLPPMLLDEATTVEPHELLTLSFSILRHFGPAQIGLRGCLSGNCTHNCQGWTHRPGA